MAHRAISVTDAPVASGNYSQAIVAAGLLFVAGNGPYDPVTRKVVGETIEEQTDRTMRNIEAILNGAGLDWSHVVNTTAYLEHLLRDWAGFDRVYGTFLTPALSGPGDDRRGAEEHPGRDQRGRGDALVSEFVFVTDVSPYRDAAGDGQPGRRPPQPAVRGDHGRADRPAARAEPSAMLPTWRICPSPTSSEPGC